MSFSFILLNLSFILILGMLAYVLKIKHKRQIHYAFIIVINSILIWTLGYLGLFYCYYAFGYDSAFFIKMILTGVVTTPVSIYYLGYIYAKTKANFTLVHKLLLIIPFISLLLVYTNEYHGLFYTYFSASNTTHRQYGSWTIIHIIYSYGLIIVGLRHLIYSSVKNSGFFSKQSRLIITGIAVPLLINLLITFQIGNLPYYFESISFSFAIICFIFAIFKFQFLNIAPIALQQVIDRISDGFIVVNEEFQIVDFNNAIISTFNGIVPIRRNMNLGQVLEVLQLGPDNGSLLELISDAKEGEKSISYNKHILGPNFDRYFKVEITPIIQKNNYLGSILLFKDTTENIKAIATIEEKHAIMMEQERLASLGQLIGGIAHNLKTPIMSIAGAVEGLRDLVAEYEASIGDKSVTAGDHREIASEMRSWLDKIKPYCAYMTDVIDTVKGQTMQASAGSMFGFTLNELVKRIELLLKYELIRFKCRMNTTINVDINTEFYGDVNSLIQVFDNIIINAIQSYGGKNGLIDFTVDEIDGDILFVVKDYGKGIPERIKGRLLKEMVTTKGKHGTGLGLYMSNSTIKGRFGGRMWFESEQGKGTTFFVQIPQKKKTV